MSSSVMPLMMLMLMRQVGNDLLDYLDTAAYWKAKGAEVTVTRLLVDLKPPVPVGNVDGLIRDLGSADFKTRKAAQDKLLAMGPAVLPRIRTAVASDEPEIAFRAEQIMVLLSEPGKSRDVRRLMAIRTLGEKKARESLPALRRLLDSKTPFEAEYARTAIAAIEGKPAPTRKRTTANDAKRDPWLMPVGTGLIGQVTFLGGKPMEWEALLQQMPLRFRGVRPSTEEGIAQLTHRLLPVVEHIGNCRIESVTLGLAGEIGRRTGRVVIMARGQYDAAAVGALLGQQKRIETTTIAGEKVWVLDDDEAYVAFPSDNLAVFVGGARNVQKVLPDVFRALKAGRGSILKNTAMVKLLESVDRTKPLWVATTVTPAFKKIELFAPLNALALTVDAERDAIRVRIVATGPEPAKITPMVEKLKGFVREGIAAVQPAMQPTPASAKLMLDFLQSATFQQNGAVVTATAGIKGTDMSPSIMLPVLWMSATAVDRAIDEAQRPKTAPISGTVTVDGKPLGEGTIMFIPKHPNKGPAGRGIIRDGKYDEITAYRTKRGGGAVIGPNLVIIRLPEESPVQVPGKYGNPMKTPLLFEVKPGKNTFDVKIVLPKPEAEE